MHTFSKHNDEELLKLIASGDHQAFKELFDRYWDKAYRIALAKLKSKELAEEIVLDVFMNIWQRRKSIMVENFANYLAVAIKYRVITFMNKELAQKKRLEGLKDLAPATSEEAMTSIEYNELMRAIDMGVKTLPEKAQFVFRLNRIEGRSISEIAHLLNLSEKAIQYHITRSVKELRVYLKDYLLFIIALAMWN